MTNAKKAIALIFVILAASISAVPIAVAANRTDFNTADACTFECNHNESKVNAVNFSEYQDRISDIRYTIRAHRDLEPEIGVIVLSYLIKDGVFSEGAVLDGIEEEEVFLRFIDSNVTIEYFGEGTRNPRCCNNGPLVLYWEWLFEGRKYVNGLCKSHCRTERQRCVFCHGFWFESRHRIIQSSCDKLQAHCPSPHGVICAH